METLIIKKNEDTPAIVFQPDKKNFKITGTSWPENSNEFYKPVHSWLEKFFKQKPEGKLNFIFRLNYMNTSSSKQIAKIINFLKEQSKNFDVNIIWQYEKDDLDMLNEGMRLKTLLKMDNFIIEEGKMFAD